MVASRETLQDLAAERQLQPATLERVIRLIDILDAFGADTADRAGVALKGGTALNVFHSDLDRLSVDIDVNYVGAIEKERMDADRPGLEDRIARLMESKGSAARREPSERAGANGSIAMRPRLAERGRSRSTSTISTAVPLTAWIACRRP
jgi:nucleotidyltransferase AbiEii toxin of type IV toxin-antitoxin system